MARGRQNQHKKAAPRPNRKRKFVKSVKKRKTSAYENVPKENFTENPAQVSSDEQDDDSENDNENEAAFKELLQKFSAKRRKTNTVVSSSDSSESEMDEPPEKSSENCEENDEENEPVINEQEIDLEDEKTAQIDPFVQHFHYELNDSLLDAVKNTHLVKSNETWPVLGRILVQLPTVSDSQKEIDSKNLQLEQKIYAKSGSGPTIVKKLENQAIKTQIFNQIEKSSKLTDFQREIFSIVNQYQDFYYPERTFTNGEEIRLIYSLHALNHVLKTRTKIIHHNAKLNHKSEVPEEFRDHGLVRPKVLIVVPFRDAAYRIVEMMINLLVPDEKTQITNKKRFTDDFTGHELQMPRKNPKPDDYQKLFSGNTDDTFRIGLAVTKKSLKLYTEFYSSDIIIASPLGLRVIIGAPGESERDFDFLSSIEMLVLDQCEQFLMQNWDHFLHVMDHLHLQPKDSHGTDMSRVRHWSLNGWAKYYRQTLIFSSYQTPEINSLFNKRCQNYHGKIKVENPIDTGTICHVYVQIPHVFHRFKPTSIQTSSSERLEFFISKILPQYRDVLMKHTMIYIPSYFDFVKVRNYFQKEDLNFDQICEYTKDGRVAKARDEFFHGDKHFLLYSERFHHFRRIRVKGIRHLIFYQPPNVPNFYPELVNLMLETNQNPKSGSMANMSVTVLYSKYDLIYLNAVIGTERTATMFESDKNTFMFMTGE